MGVNCLRCGGTLIMANGQPCPDCNKDTNKILPVYSEIPVQYQGLVFDKELLPSTMPSNYGDFLDELWKDIVNNISTYQKNLLICSRPNSGKSVWSYHLYSHLKANGVKVPVLKDIIELRNILNCVERDYDACNEYTKARVVMVRLPRQLSPDIFDTMQFIIERRVRCNGFTIFLYGGVIDDIKSQDYYGKLKYLTGTGSFNTIEVNSFYDIRKGEKHFE